MKIQTEYNIKDTVWFIANNKISFGFITSIRVEVSHDNTSILYGVAVKYEDPRKNYIESLVSERVFKTKELLIKSL